MTESPTPKPWIDRMAEELAKESETCSLTTGLLKAVMEAAVEMRCVAMKIALARCYEILWQSRVSEEAASSDEEFEKHIYGLFQ